MYRYDLRPRKTKRVEATPKSTKPTAKRRRKTIRSHPIQVNVQQPNSYRNLGTIRSSPFRSSPPRVSRIVIANAMNKAVQVPAKETYLSTIMDLFRLAFVRHPKTGHRIILGEGTYNMAYLVKDRMTNKEYVLRIMKPTCNDENVANMNGEIRLTKRFSDLFIGTPVYKSVMYKQDDPVRGTCYGTAMLMGKMDSDLRGVLVQKGRTRVVFNATTLAKTLIRSVHNLANEGYMCADIKPENFLVKGNAAFMADFDTKFCGRGSFIDRISKKYGIRQATSITKRQLGPKSWKNLRDMYSRAMIFMLIKYILGREEYRNIRSISFVNALIETYEKHYLSKQKGIRKILLGGKQVPALEVLRFSIPGFETRNKKTGETRFFNVKNMVEHYHGKNIFTGDMYKKWFGTFR